MTAPQRIVVIGAAGEMTSVALRRLGSALPELALELYDLDAERVQELATGLPNATIGTLDLFDRGSLAKAIQGARLVVLGAGPYLRTSEPVIDACMEAGVDYLDYSDDNEPTAAALARTDEVGEAKIAAYIGCGASPGLSNVMAVDVASYLDSIDSIDVAWCTGDEGPRPYGRAVIEHLMHIAAGDCLLWRDGRPTTVPSFGASERIEMGGGLGSVSLYECAHPEAVTLPRRFPHARSIRVLGGLYPLPINGIARGVAQAVHDGRLDIETAVGFFQDIMQDKTGSVAGWRFAFPGIGIQLGRNEISAADIRRFAWDAMVHRHGEYRGGLLTRAAGTRAGQRTTITSTMELSGPHTVLWQSMGTATGFAIAAFIALALAEPQGKRVGVYCPEDWVQPADMYKTLHQLGVPDAELPRTTVTAVQPGPTVGNTA